MLNNVADTLKADTAMLDAWRCCDDYDYAREMVQSDFSIREWILMHIGRWFDYIFGSGFYADNRTFIWGLISAILIVAVIAFVFRHKLVLFSRAGKDILPYDITEDTIYGIDFPEEISQAMNQRNYREAVRLVYLYALKELTDSGCIDWQPYKTPAQYASEVGTHEFRLFSNHFQRVRYGNFTATDELVEEMQRLRLVIVQGVNKLQKGGNE